MKAIRKMSLSLVFFLTFSFLPDLQGIAFTGTDLPPSVKQKTVNYEITGLEPSAEPGIVSFQVRSVHGTYTPEGFLGLVKLLHEIDVIERVKKDDRSGGFFEGASASVESTGEGLKNLVAHPVGSAKGIGKAAGELGKGVGRLFKKKEAGEKTSFGESFLGSEERVVAKELTVDVYTSNPILKNMMTGIAKARLGGKGAVTVMTILIPIAVVASLALTAGTLNDAADQLVDDHGRSELFRLNQKALEGLGLRKDSVARFLNASVLTPREQTYFRFYVEKLKYVPGVQDLFETAAQADTSWSLRRKLFEAQLAANGDKGEFTALWPHPEGLMLQQKSGRLIFVTAYDDLSGDFADKVLKRCQEYQNKTQQPLSLWNGGKIDGGIVRRAQGLGITSHSWFYLLGDKVREEL